MFFIFTAKNKADKKRREYEESLGQGQEFNYEGFEGDFKDFEEIETVSYESPANYREWGEEYFERDSSSEYEDEVGYDESSLGRIGMAGEGIFTSEGLMSETVAASESSGLKKAPALEPIDKNEIGSKDDKIQLNAGSVLQGIIWSEILSRRTQANHRLNIKKVK